MVNIYILLFLLIDKDWHSGCYRNRGGAYIKSLIAVKSSKNLKGELDVSRINFASNA